MKTNMYTIPQSLHVHHQKLLALHIYHTFSHLFRSIFMSTQKKQNIFVVIPAYNEEQSLLHTLQDIPSTDTSAYVISTLVVDNNSTDGTFLLATKHSDYVIRECRRGYGQAVHSGILEAKRKGADIIVVLDADGSDPPQNIPLIVEPILSNTADFVLGQRMHLSESGSLTPLQKYGNRFACRLMKYVIQKIQRLGFFASNFSTCI